MLGGILLEKVVNRPWTHTVFGGDVKFLLGRWGKPHFTKETYTSTGSQVKVSPASRAKETVQKVKIVLNDTEIPRLTYWNIALILLAAKCRNKIKRLRYVSKEKISAKMKNLYNKIEHESF